jgi:hypothetical protein
MSLKEYITEKEAKAKPTVDTKSLVDNVVGVLNKGSLTSGLTITTVHFDGKSEIKKISESLEKLLGEGIKSDGEIIYDGGKDYNVKIKKDGDKIKAIIKASPTGKK